MELRKMGNPEPNPVFRNQARVSKARKNKNKRNSKLKEKQN